MFLVLNFGCKIEIRRNLVMLLFFVCIKLHAK